MLNPYIGLLLIVAYNIATAWVHAQIIKRNKPIHHWMWAAFYVAFCWGVMWWAHNEYMIFFCLFIRKPVFDVLLNFFRGLPLLYVSHDSGSLIDDVHFSLFGGKSIAYLIVYAALSILSIIII